MIIVVVINMTVATANLKRVQEGRSEEIEVYPPICVAQTNEVREYEDKSNCPNADCESLFSSHVDAETR